MTVVLTVVGILIIISSVVLGFNIFTEASNSVPIGMLSESISNAQRNAAYAVWICGLLVGLFFLALGRIIELLETLVKAKKNG